MVSERATERGLELAIATPDADSWRRFLSRSLGLFGAGLVLAGVICFVAYNWTRVGRFGKFAVIEAAIVAATLVGWRKLPGLSGQLALTGAAVLVGALLAVYGQTYQTGADPYGLFLTWAVLIIPWVIAARFAALWLILIALLDTAAILFWVQVLDLRYAADPTLLPLALAGLHAIALAAWEWQLRRQSPWIDEAWAARVVAATGFFAAWLSGAIAILETARSPVPDLIPFVALAAAIAAVYHYHRNVRRDRFMVAVGIGAGMALITVAVGRLLFRELDLDTGGFFLMAAFVVVEISVGLWWFRGRRPARSS